MSYAVMAEVARRRLGRAVEASAELHKAEIAQAFGILRYPWVMRHDDHMDAYSLAWKAASQLRMLDSGNLSGVAMLGRAANLAALQSAYRDPYWDVSALFGPRGGAR